jgi:hypothetical protein
MKFLKISTLALALALTGWIACGSDTTDSKQDTAVIGTGGTIGPVGGSGGSTGTLDAGGVIDTATADAPFQAADTAPPVDVSDTGPTVDPCAGLTAAQCHDSIINAATTSAALDPGLNPAVPYPSCSAQ